MERYAEHTADALITGTEAEDKRFRARAARWSFPFGARLFAAFALLKLAF